MKKRMMTIARYIVGIALVVLIVQSLADILELHGDARLLFIYIGGFAGGWSLDSFIREWKH